VRPRVSKIQAAGRRRLAAARVAKLRAAVRKIQPLVRKLRAYQRALRVADEDFNSMKAALATALPVLKFSHSRGGVVPIKAKRVRLALDEATGKLSWLDAGRWSKNSLNLCQAEALYATARDPLLAEAAELAMQHGALKSAGKLRAEAAGGGRRGERPHLDARRGTAQARTSRRAPGPRPTTSSPRARRSRSRTTAASGRPRAWPCSARPCWSTGASRAACGGCLTKRLLS
jgi:hypothetical protein